MAKTVEEYWQEYTRKLPDSLWKHDPSYISKIMKIVAKLNKMIMEIYETVELWNNIEEAKGKTLDLLGKRVGQKRGVASDEIYRVLIRARIARNNSDGTINSMLKALALSVDTTPNTIKIKALYTEGQPTSLRIEGIPIAALNKVGLNSLEFGAIAQSIAAAGISVSAIDLSGTFAFSSKPSEPENSVEFGLAPLDRSTGGTLGSVISGDDTVNLPI